MSEGTLSYEKFANKVIELQQTLSQMPHIGALEPLLTHRSIPYRGILVNKKNKLIYHLAEDTLIIDDLWDTRREPTVQALNMK